MKKFLFVSMALIFLPASGLDSAIASEKPEIFVQLGQNFCDKVQLKV